MILITGMHRSGTSLVAMTLETLGLPFGDHSAFFSADQWNARGYFERRDVMDINSRMITGFSRTTSSPQALASQIRYLLEPRLDRVLARGHRYADLMRYVRDATGDGAIKDPRLCLTWSAWADEVDVEACVVCIRHPLDVAESLRRRQRIPLSIGFRFWRYHMRALRDVTPPNLIVVDFASLIESPEVELRLLVDGLGLDINEQQALDSFWSTYSPELAQRSEADERTVLDDETGELWTWLQGLRNATLPNGYD